jgi:glycosyltransferase involved in cell wall biosynthesis
MIQPDATRRWRIHHVITRLIVGGAQENTIASVLGLRQRPDFDVRLLSGPTTGAEGSLEHLFNEHPGALTLLPHLIRAVRPWTDWLAYRDLVRSFRRDRPHLVHTHSGKAGVLGRLAARKAGVPVILHTVHGPSFGPFQGPAANALFTRAERIAARVTDHFVVVANAMTRQYVAAGVAPESRFTRIFSGFDLNPFLNAQPDPVLAARLGIQPGDFVIGKIARLFELKGHDDLFLAAPELVRRIPNLKILLVGDGPWRQRFEALAAQPDLAGRILFAGLVPPSAVPAHLALMDVLVHLSRREGLARVLPQALAAGKPIIAYDCDGASEVCMNNETGYLLAPDDLNGLVNRIGQLADAPEIGQHLAQTGRAFVHQRFPTERMVDDLDLLCRDWIRRKQLAA